VNHRLYQLSNNPWDVIVKTQKLAAVSVVTILDIEATAKKKFETKIHKYETAEKLSFKLISIDLSCPC
jgi:hypothetical protein